MRKLAVVLMIVGGLAQATTIWTPSTGLGVVPGAQDPNWELLYSTDGTNFTTQGNAYVVVDNGWPGSWIANDSQSQWLATRASYPMDSNIDPAGYYMFRTTFSLGTLPSNPELRGFWSGDNQGVRIDLNSASITLPGGNAYGSMHPFAFNSGFVAGQNTLALVIHNDVCADCSPKPNPMGGRMDILTPEPGSLLLIGIGLLCLAGIARRRIK
jgi:hypothetical protein